MYALTNCNILAKKQKRWENSARIHCLLLRNNLGWLVLFYLSPHCDHAFCKKVGSPGVDRRADDTQALPRWGQWASAVWGCLGGGECSAARGEQQTPRRRSSRQPIDHHSHTSTSATGPSRFLPYAAQRRCRCYDCTRLLGIWPDLFVRRNIATVERTKGLCSRLPLALQKQPPARAAIIQNRILA